jgi:hypothetical protein
VALVAAMLVQSASLATTQMTAQHATRVQLATHDLHMATVTHVRLAMHGLLMVTAMLVRLMVAAIRVRHAMIVHVATQTAHLALLVVASVIATVPSAQAMDATTRLVLKSALQSAVGQMTAAVKSATQTAQTAQLATTHVSQLSAVPVTQTQTRRHSSKTRFLSG